MNKMEDVKDEELRVQPVALKSTKEEDNEIIQRSIAAMNNQKGLDNIPALLDDGKDGANYYEIKGLPSKGRLYPEGTIIKGRPLKVIEVKKLSSLNETNADFIVNDIIKRTVRGIQSEKIFIADKLAIIFWLRANTYRDSKYIVNFTCSKCEKESDYHFDLDNIEVKYLDDNYDPSRELTLSSGEKVRIKFLTIEDEISIGRFKELNTNLVGEADGDLLTIAAMIQTTEKISLTEKYLNVLNMNPQDFSMITSYIEKYGMGIKPYFNVKCNSCGGTSQIGVSFRADFFIPTYKFE